MSDQRLPARRGEDALVFDRWRESPLVRRGAERLSSIHAETSVWDLLIRRLAMKLRASVSDFLLQPEVIKGDSLELNPEQDMIAFCCLYVVARVKNPLEEWTIESIDEI